MKCALQNCQREGIWSLDIGDSENHYCDDCYQVMAVLVRAQTLEYAKHTLWGRAHAEAIKMSNRSLSIDVLPEPKMVSPNVDIAVCQAVISLSHLQQKHRLTKVQTAIAAQAICRVLFFVTEYAHREAVQGN